MNIIYKIILYLLICIFICSSFYGCSKNSNTLKSDNTEKIANLDSWVGDYKFSEYVPPDKNMFYSITVYKDNNEYFAKIYIDGFQTIVRVKAKVCGDKNSIELIFNKYLPDNVNDLYKNGDILLSFKKKDSKVYTYWGKIQPMIYNNSESGKVYF